MPHHGLNTILSPEVKAAAVISSYAEPLLEGCGSIKKGDLRVVGQTQPVPFVTALVSDELDPAMQKQVLLSLITAAALTSGGNSSSAVAASLQAPRRSRCSGSSTPTAARAASAADDFSSASAGPSSTR